MADLVTLRNSLASSLSAAGRVVYAFPREQITPPALVLVPASPYLSPVSIGGLSNRINVRFELTAVVGAADNQAALANIESLALSVFDLLPTGTAVINGWTQPQIVEISGQQMLTSSLNIELVTTNNGN
jgi:hypothetical protein